MRGYGCQGWRVMHQCFGARGPPDDSGMAPLNNARLLPNRRRIRSPRRVGWQRWGQRPRGGSCGGRLAALGARRASPDWSRVTLALEDTRAVRVPLCSHTRAGEQEAEPRGAQFIAVCSPSILAEALEFHWRQSCQRDCLGQRQLPLVGSESILIELINILE